MNRKARDREKGAELIEMAFVLLLLGNLIAAGNYSRHDPVQICGSTSPLIVEPYLKLHPDAPF